MQQILSAVIAAAVSVGTFFGLYQEPAPMNPEIQKAIEIYVNEALEGPIAGATLPIAGQTFNLHGSGVSASASSITLASFTITQTGQKIQDSDLSATFFITLEPGNPTKQEIVSCTTVTQNANNSATLSGCSRGLSPITPYTASTTLRFAHGGGSQVIFSNPPQFYNQYPALDNDNTFVGIQSFHAVPRYTAVPSNHSSGAVASTTAEFASMAAVQAVVAAGCLDAAVGNQGCVELATEAEISAGTQSGSDARLVLTASSSTSSPNSSLCGAGCVPATRSDGKISPLFIATTSSDAYKFGGLVTLTATGTFATTTQASSTITNLNVTSTSTTGTFSALTSTATSSFAGNVTVGANASTSDLIVSNSCTGCPMANTGSSTTFSVTSGTNTYTGSIPTFANTGLGRLILTAQGSTLKIDFILTRSGKTTSSVTWQDNGGDGDSGEYTLSWSGNNFAVTEDTDVNTNMSITGTVYWYK